MTKISVCIATYNGEKYIIEQLNSILCQLNDDDEVVISDDYSTDNTLELIRSINDKRIKIVYNNSDKGYTANFENALIYCKGDYIFLSDQDDIWEKNKVSICVNLLDRYDFVVSDCLIIDDEKKIINNSFFKFRKTSFSIAGNIIRFGFIGCSFAFKRNVLEVALPFPKNRKYCTHDNWIFLVSSIFFKYKVIHSPLFYYRRHGSNTSSGGSKSKLNMKDKVFYRIYLVYNLILRYFKY